ncbi:MAG: DUF4190 domain-containing protein [Actinobacteria bacterium]|nr:DUF4190 domain-containing protein [Actinomycetota bacterium]
MFAGLNGWHLVILLAVLVVVAGVVVAISVAVSGSKRRQLAPSPAAQPGVPYGTTYAGAPYGAAPRTNTMAILSLIFAFFFSLLAVIFGHVARSQIGRTGEGGRGLATAGLILGHLGILGGVIAVIVGVVAATSVHYY